MNYGLVADGISAIPTFESDGSRVENRAELRARVVRAMRQVAEKHAAGGGAAEFQASDVLALGLGFKRSDVSGVACWLETRKLLVKVRRGGKDDTWVWRFADGYHGKTKGSRLE